MCLVLCLCHAVFITVALLCILKPGSMLPLLLLFLLTIALTIQDLLVASCKCLLLFCISVTTALLILIGLAMRLQLTLACINILAELILLGFKHDVSFPVSVSYIISTRSVSEYNIRICFIVVKLNQGLVAGSLVH